MNQVSGTEVMQHFKAIVVGQYKYDTLIIDSWTKDKQIGTNFAGSIGYCLTGFTGNFEKYKMNFGFSAQYQSTDHYPVQNYGHQTVMNIIPSVAYKRYFSHNTFTIVPGIGFEYRKNLLKEMEYVVTDQCIPEFQSLDYQARNSDFMKGQASLTVIMKSGIKSISEYFLDCKADYAYIPDSGKGALHNLFINCSIGLIF
jgi:hypothetical protein